jgi:DNA-binding CsgD family transcriptional regulator
MSLLFDDIFTRVAQVSCRESLRRQVVRFAQDIEFRTVTAMGVLDRVGDFPVFQSVENPPKAYLPIYENVEEGRTDDPVMQHCKRSSMPLIWDQSIYARVGLHWRWERQAAHGYRTGLAVAMHLPRGRHFMIGVDRDEDLPTDAQVLSGMVATLHMFTVCAHEVALKIFFGQQADASTSSMLTSREVEVLRWTMDGKTAWEVGRILGISEQTVVRHVSAATRKLDCVNKHHAVVKALRLGLIH